MNLEKLNKIVDKANAVYRAGKTKKAIKLYRKAADNGSVSAMLSLAKHYSNEYKGKKDAMYRGLIPRNLALLNGDDGLEWYEQAFKASGEFDAAFCEEIGDYCVLKCEFEEWNNQHDYEAAVKWYERAVDNGNIAVSMKVADSHLAACRAKHPSRFFDKSKAKEKAYEWYEKAVNFGVGDSKTVLKIADYYKAKAKGGASSKNSSLAIEWYEKAIAMGEDGVKQALDTVKQNAEQGEIERLYREGSKAYDGGNYKKALRLFEQGAQLGDSRAVFSIAMIYLEGKGVEQDSQRAEQLADEGNAEAMLMLARNSNGRTATEWYRRSAEAGNVEAEIELEKRYLKSESKAALEYFKNKAICGDVNAMLYAAEHTEGNESLEYYKMAADSGHSQSMMYVAEHTEGDESFEYYRKAAEKGVSAAALVLVKESLKRNKSEDAWRWMQIVGEHELRGNLFAEGKRIYKLADFTEEHFNRELAYLYFKAAAMRGDADAYKKLDMYQRLHSARFRSVNSDINECYRYAVKHGYLSGSSKDKVDKTQNDAISFDYLRDGNRYYHGTGGAYVNYQKAFENYQKAAEYGAAEGLYGIGRLYENGQGVPQDVNKAIEYYEMAAAKGSINAKSELPRLKSSLNAKSMSVKTSNSTASAINQNMPSGPDVAAASRRIITPSGLDITENVKNLPPGEHTLTNSDGTQTLVKPIICHYHPKYKCKFDTNYPILVGDISDGYSISASYVTSYLKDELEKKGVPYSFLWVNEDVSWLDSKYTEVKIGRLGQNQGDNIYDGFSYESYIRIRVSFGTTFSAEHEASFFRLAGLKRPSDVSGDAIREMDERRADNYYRSGASKVEDWNEYQMRTAYDYNRERDYALKHAENYKKNNYDKVEKYIVNLLREIWNKKDFYVIDDNASCIMPDGSKGGKVTCKIMGIKVRLER